MHLSIVPSLGGTRQGRWHRRPGSTDAQPSLQVIGAPIFLGVLTASALVDWLITRTVTRFAIFLPKTPAMITLYQALSWLGLFGSAVAALAALAGVVWIVRAEWQTQRIPWLAALLAGLAGLSVLFLFIPSGGWQLLYFLLAVSACVGLGWRATQMQARTGVRLAVLTPAAALAIALLHMAGPTAYAVMNWPGPAAWSAPLFLVGEALVIVSACALWWAFGRQATPGAWLMGGAPALLFAAVYLAAPALTASVVVWSMGLTLYLPWPLYAIALWLCGVVIVSTWRQLPVVAGAVLLLAATGYAPQLSSQLFYALIALWLLTTCDGHAGLGSPPTVSR